MMTAIVQRLFNIRREEVVPVMLAALFFFCVLTALMLLRPAREALGMQRGLEAVRWLFIGTALVTLLVNPVFGLLVSRLRRLQFITATYGFFALSLLAFYLVMILAPEAIGIASGQVFYVWFSVFNLFSTMVFWALMVDRFSLEQSKRFFGVIAVGGTCGAVFGPWLASLLANPLGTPALLLVSIGFLLLAVGIAWLIYVPFGRTRLWDRVRGHEVPDWAAEFDARSWAQFFLKFVLAHPAVTAVTPATSKPHHMVDNMGAALGGLPDEAMRKRMIEFIDSL